MIIIGYSGHAYVAIGILSAAGRKVKGYCDFDEKAYNPFNLEYLGKETDEKGMEMIRMQDFFIGIGDNSIRKKVFGIFEQIQRFPVNAVHPSSAISGYAQIDPYGVMISSGVCINPLATIGKGVICNTGSIIEHECEIGNFAHVGPGAVLCGNVTIGEGSFIGAAAVVRQGIRIGKNAMIGAGAVVVKDVGDAETVAGNPSRLLIK